MVRRRTRFAAPFVLIACSGPADRAPSHPTIVESELDRTGNPHAVIPIDAAVDAPVRVVERTCDPNTYAGPDAPLCNPPPPAPKKIELPLCPEPGDPPDPNGPKCNPPAPRAVVARIIRVEVAGDHRIVTVNRGTKDGVKKSWRGVFVKDSGKPFAGQELAIVRVDRETVRLRVDITELPGQTIRLEPR